MNSSPHSSWIVETTDDHFESDVLERSFTVPVVVDFWAEWCQPCRLLGPVLDQLAREMDGQFVLVKANTETTPQAAAQFGVQSIPAVFGLRSGRIVDTFLGALPEEQIRQWLQRVLPSPADQLLDRGQSLLVANPKEAEDCFRQAIAAEPNLFAAHIALAELLLNQQRPDECQQTIDLLQQRGFLEPEAERIRAALDRQRQGAVVDDVQACRAAVAQAPDDLQLQLNLADALAAQEDYAEALQLGLQVVQKSSGTLREKARQTMVDIFRLLPDDSELTRQYRRQLSMALY